jgi:phospho-N-acetylmuramoyl-pentapeptide-transferase
MGGSLIIFSMILPMLLWGELDNVFVWMTMTVTVGYGMIGFYDDYQKISKKNSAGLAGRWKLFWQFAIAGGVMAVLLWGYQYSPVLAFPFANFTDYNLYLGPYLYLIFAAIVIAGFSNAVNLTDGLDGLAIVPVTISSGTFLVLSYAAGGAIGIVYNNELIRFNFAEYLRVPSIPGAEELSVFAGAMAGAGLAFLWYNSYPAQVFMGDVGALALGGGLGTMAVCTKNEFLLVIIGGVFVMETLSVVMQVTYFKYMKRRFGEETAKKNRLFKMTPIHHHFEKSGWPEPKVIVRFWIISVVLSLIALSSLKLR